MSRERSLSSPCGEDPGQHGQRADQPHLNDLEQPYYDAAVYAEEQFKHEVDQQMVLNSGLTGVLFGGIVGAIVRAWSESAPPYGSE